MVKRFTKFMLPLFSQKGRHAFLMSFCIHMEFMTKIHVPLLDILQNFLETETAKSYKIIIKKILEKVSSGAPLSEALSNFPRIFDPIFLSLIRVGEETGNLSNVFSNLRAHFQWKQKTNETLSKNLWHPVLLIILCVITLYILATYLIPPLSEFLKSANPDALSRIKTLLLFTDTLTIFLPGLILVLLTAVLGSKLLNKFLPHALWPHKFLLSLPFYGKVTQSLFIIRFSHTLSMTLKAKLSLLESLSLLSNIERNHYFKQNILFLHEKIMEGQSLSASIKGMPIFKPFFIRLVQVGETSNTLSDVFDIIESFETDYLKRKMDRLIERIQPITLLVVGLIFVWIAIDVFLPLYDTLRFS